MITKEQLLDVSHVYVHANCPDGLASAMVITDAYRRSRIQVPPIEFIQHGSPEHKRAGIGQRALFCDIAPHLARPKEALVPGEDLSKVIVLDHHISAKGVVEQLGGIYSDEPGVSGAVLAFRWVWQRMLDIPERGILPPRFDDVEDFVTAIGARDTWDKRDPKLFTLGQHASRYIMAADRQTMLDGGPTLTDEEWSTAAFLSEQHLRLVRNVVADKLAITNYPWGKTVVFADNAHGPKLTSDLADAVREMVTEPHITAGFWFEPNSNMVVSLRSTHFDVSKLAGELGGGGHQKAAGFQLHTPTLVGDAATPSPFDLVREVLHDLAPARFAL